MNADAQSIASKKGKKKRASSKKKSNDSDEGLINFVNFLTITLLLKNC
jgi:hypothetical protein